MRHSFVRFLYMAVSVYLIFLLLRYPALSLRYALAGLNLWFVKMIPTLLPFMILSGILIHMNLTEGFVRLLHPVLHFFYGTTPNGSYTLIMGFLCGFPMGARIAGELCRTGRLSTKEGNRLLAFCNNIGPIYFLSFVVSTLSLEKPLVPFLVMYGVPLVYGLFVMRISLLFQLPYRMFKERNTPYICRPTKSVALTDRKQLRPLRAFRYCKAWRLHGFFQPSEYPLSPIYPHAGLPFACLLLCAGNHRRHCAKRPASPFSRACYASFRRFFLYGTDLQYDTGHRSVYPSLFMA